MTERRKPVTAKPAEPVRRLYTISDRDECDNSWVVRASTPGLAWICFAESQELTVAEAKRQYKLETCEVLEGE